MSAILTILIIASTWLFLSLYRVIEDKDDLVDLATDLTTGQATVLEMINKAFAVVRHGLLAPSPEVSEDFRGASEGARSQIRHFRREPVPGMDETRLVDLGLALDRYIDLAASAIDAKRGPDGVSADQRAALGAQAATLVGTCDALFQHAQAAFDSEKVQSAHRVRKSMTAAFVVLAVAIGVATGLAVWVAKVLGRLDVSILATDAQILERQRAEMRLEHKAAELASVNAELELFAYIASHDLQEPLRMVSSFLRLLSQKYRDRLDDRGCGWIDQAMDGAQRMRSMIEGLLSYSRTGRGDVPGPVDARAALEQALLHLRPMIQETAAVIRVDGDLPRVLSTETNLVSVFQNLISNALKYRSSTAPAITVSARQRDLEWEFALSDNGVGIPPDLHARIFELFQRGAAVRGIAGSGLGLAICRKSIESVGGRIWVESTPEMGSTFRFTLPAG